MSTVIALHTSDVRFPTSASLDGSDAMNRDPDYSAAYVRIETDAEDGLEGHGFVFTIGRGNDVQVAAIDALASACRATDGGEAWLILSDLAEQLGLRTNEELQKWIADAGLSGCGDRAERCRCGGGL